MAFEFFKSKKMQGPTHLDVPFPSFPIPREIDEHSMGEIKEVAGAESLPEADQKIPSKQKSIKSSPQSKPVFLKIDVFESIVNNIGQVRASLDEDKLLLTRLEDLSAQQENQYQKWRGSLEDVHKKLIFIDEILFRRR